MHLGLWCVHTAEVHFCCFGVLHRRIHIRTSRHHRILYIALLLCLPACVERYCTHLQHNNRLSVVLSIRVPRNDLRRWSEEFAWRCTCKLTTMVEAVIIHADCIFGPTSGEYSLTEASGGLHLSRINIMMQLRAEMSQASATTLLRQLVWGGVHTALLLSFADHANAVKQQRLLDHLSLPEELLQVACQASNAALALR